MKITQDTLRRFIKQEIQQVRALQEDDTDSAGDPDPNLWDDAAMALQAALEEMVKVYEHTGQSPDEVADNIRIFVDGRLKKMARVALIQKHG